MLVVLAYVIARLTANSKTAGLIRNLSITDFFWFLSSLIQSSYWIGGRDVPDNLCYVCSPVVNFCRMASLIWTCAISFDVLMSVKKRTWQRKGEEKRWQEYRIMYYCVVAVVSLPGAIYNIYKQHNGDASLGCGPGYEELGAGVVVFFTELLPIILGFFTNVYVFFLVRQRMALKAFPLSVRKKRRRVMYHYIIASIVCWTPTMIFYIAELCGLHSPLLEVISRVSLYSTGFFNFLLIALQDPHLKRSLQVTLYLTGIHSLKTSNVDKSVMFGGQISDNADHTKDKKNIYRYHKLTKEDKAALYSARPDLDPKMQYTRDPSASKIREPLLSERDRSLYEGEGDRGVQEIDVCQEEEDEDYDEKEDDAEEEEEEGTAGGATPDPVMDYIDGAESGAVFNPVIASPSTPREKPLINFVHGTEDTESSSDEDDEEDVGLTTPVGSMIQEFFSRSPPS